MEIGCNISSPWRPAGQITLPLSRYAGHKFTDIKHVFQKVNIYWSSCEGELPTSRGQGKGEVWGRGGGAGQQDREIGEGNRWTGGRHCRCSGEKRVLGTESIGSANGERWEILRREKGYWDWGKRYWGLREGLLRTDKEDIRGKREFWGWRQRCPAGKVCLIKD